MTRTSSLTELVTLCKLGLHGTLMMPIAALERRATWSQLMLVTGLNLLVQFLSDLFKTGSNGEFVAQGLPAALFILPVVLFAAWALGKWSAQPELSLLLATTFGAIAVPIDIAYHVSLWTAERGRLSPGAADILLYAGFYVAMLWYSLAAGVAAARLLALPPTRWLAAVPIALVVIGMPLALVYRDPTLWRPVADPVADANYQRQRNTLLREDILYLQPALLDRQLAALKAGRSGIVDLYFVGMAGFADQDVFMKEVQSVTTLFNQRFDTLGRSIMLINNPKTAAQQPIASVTSLERSLKRIGDLMNRDEDILFLFLTSHGSKDHRFSLEFGAMQFHDLEPQRLQAMLDASGIRHRVIVVSACYSGGFVETLKNPHSLIITAAAADRNSFGCSHENDFTYFGQAYFNEALRQTDSFITAFDLAQPVIAAREKEQDFDSSNPQIFIGQAIRAPLARFGRQLATNRVNRPSANGDKPPAPRHPAL